MDTDQIISELTEHAAKAMAEAVRNAFEHGRKMGREEAREDARLAFEEALNKAFEKQGAVQKRVEEAALRVVAAKKEEDGARAKKGECSPLGFVRACLAWTYYCERLSSEAKGPA